MSNTISSSLKGKRHDLQTRIRQEMLSRSKLSQKHIDRVFGTGITSYQIPTSIRAMILHYTAVTVVWEIHFVFFSRSTSFPYSNLIHIFILILESSILEVNHIILTDDKFFLRSDGYREREWKLLNLRMTEQTGWPFHFEKLTPAVKKQLISNSLRFAWIGFDVLVFICLSEKPRVAWEKKKRDQFSWKTACVIPAYCDQLRLLSSGVQSGVRSGNEKCNVDRIVGIEYR